MISGAFVGLTTVDLLFATPNYPAEDTKTTAHNFLTAAGGPCTNAAIVFSRLGGEAKLLSVLGDTEVADIAKADIIAQGVTWRELQGAARGAPAISSIVINASTGSRTICTSPAIDAEAPVGPNQTLLAETIAGADILLLDGHQSALALEAARLAKSKGIPVVLDGDIYRPAVRELIALADVVIFGKSFRVPECATTTDILELIGSLGVRHVAATQGEASVAYVSEGSRGEIEVATVEAVDTLAAGDFFHGAFCYQFAKEGKFAEALRFAADVATRSVQHWGPREWLKHL